MKDLEDYCAKVGTPIDIGYADLMKPILKRTQGVLEDAIAYEARRRSSSSPNAPQPSPDDTDDAP